MQKKVTDEDCICSSVFSVWHDFLCSSLTRQLFTKYTNNKNLIWECSRCEVPRCGKCREVIGHCSCILCDCCNNWFHKISSALDQEKYSNIGDTEESWFCVECMEDNTPFFTLTQRNIQIISLLKKP